MRINANPAVEPAARVTRDVPEPGIGADQKRANGGTPTRDSVHISDAGRARAAGTSQPLTPERVQQIRQRVLNGDYDSVEVLSNTARRILGSGDA